MNTQINKNYPFRFHFIAQLLLLSLIVFNSNSQNLNFRHYTTTDGLAGMSTFMSMQDSKGYIWFATTEGVSRFDGTTFSTYTNADGLSDNSVLRIYEDHLERIWFLTYNGHLSYFSLRDNTIHNENTDTLLKKLFTGAGYDNMFVDSKKRIWFSSIQSSVAILDGEKVLNPAVPKILSNTNMIVTEDSNNKIHLFTGIYKLDFSEETSTITISDTNQVIPSIGYFGSKPGINCFLTKKDICVLENGRIKNLAPASLAGVSSDAIFTANFMNNTVLVSTRNQGIIIIENCATTPKVSRYPISRSITSATIDMEGNIWLSTQNDGIYMLASQYRQGRYFSLESFKGESILSICKIGENTFLTGTYSGSLFLWRNGTFLELQICPDYKPGTGMIRTIQTDSEGNVWLFGEMGLFTGRIQNILSNPLSDANFKLLHVLKFNNLSESPGNKLIASTAQGIYHIRKDNTDWIITPDSKVTKSLKRIYTTCVSWDGSVYYSSIEGLFRYHKGKVSPVKFKKEQLNTRIKYIKETPDSVLLFSTSGNGVLFMKDGKIIHQLNEENGLASSICGKLLIKGDTIFVCTNKGLSYFRYSNRVISPIRNYNGYNGILPGEVLDVEAEGAAILAITSTGMSVVSFTMTQSAPREPEFYITGIYNYKDEMISSSSIVIPSKNNILKVKYTAITFNRTKEVQYQYKFDNNNWNTTLLTELIFPDLSPGNHMLLLRARKADSNWSTVRTIHLFVEYPFYLTWWFLSATVILAGLAFTALLIYLNRRKSRQLMLMMEKRTALNHERNRISADMHDDVGSDLSKISITSEFTKAQVDKSSSIYTQLEKISAFAYGARKKMDDIIWALNPENDTLGNLIAYVNKFGLEYFEETGIEFSVKNEITDGLDQVLNSKERRNIFLIVKELCTNVFKHSGATDFAIIFHSTGTNIIMETRDNGKGYSGGSKSLNGNGLQNIRKRVNEIQGVMIHNEQAGGGTRYQFIFNQHN